MKLITMALTRLRQRFSNPYIVLLINRGRRLLSHRLLLLWSLLWTLSAVGMLVHYISQPAWQSSVSRTIWGGAIVTLFLPSGIAIIVALQFIHRELREGRRQLLRMANLSGRMLADGYAIDVLLRIRLHLLLAAGTTPLIIIGRAHELTAREIARRCVQGWLDCPAFNLAIEPLQIAALLYIAITLVIALVSVTGTCIHTTLWMALRWQDRVLAGTFAFTLLSVSLIPLLFFFALYLDVAIHQILMFEGWISIISTLFVVTLMSIVPYFLIGEAGQRAVRRWVWHKLVSDRSQV